MMSRREWAVVSGLAVGIGIACLRLEGGYDAYYVFFNLQVKTVPAWVHLFLRPFSIFPWPWSWALMSVVTVLVLAWVAQSLGGRWWYVVLSLPVLWEIWSGQIEWLVALGLALALFAVERKISPLWLGIAWLMMASKPWVVSGLLVVITWWAFRNLSYLEFFMAFSITTAIVVLTFLIWPHWVSSWINYSGDTVMDELNGAVWPWGLASWAAVPGAKDRHSLLRRVAAASLLSSPYLRLYHATVLMVLINNPALGVFGWSLGWLILITGAFGQNWRSLAWVLPLGVLLVDRFGDKYLTSIQLFWKKIIEERQQVRE